MSKEIRRLVERAAAAFAALALGSGITIVSLLSPAAVGALPTAGGQLEQRAIYMSNSKPYVSGDPNRTYLVTFRLPTGSAGYTIKGVVLEFCSDSPIIGDTCTAPGSLTVGTPTVTFGNTATGSGDPVTSTGLTGSWTAAQGATANILKLNNNTGMAVTTGTTYSFTITTMRNPAALGSFYAKIVTYNDDTSAEFTAFSNANPGSTSAQDYGGIALSTATNISVTARVQESLVFCTSGPDVAGGTANPMNNSSAPDNCSAATSTSLTIGHDPGTGSKILDNSHVDAAFAFTQTSSNATNGVAVRMHSQNSCSGLSSDGGTTCNIPGVHTASSPSTFTAGTANFFGLGVLNGVTTTGVGSSSGTLPADANYNDGTNITPGVQDPTMAFGMDDTGGGRSVNSTYGDKIAASTAPVSQVNNTLLFGATAALTVPAGIYTAQESLIATGTF